MNWLKRHPIWTALIILSLAAAGFNYFSSRRNSSRLSYAEKAADDCTPVGSELAQVKTCLLQAGFDINQMPPADRTLTLYVGRETQIVAQAGDIPFYARSHWELSGWFPCKSWNVEAILTFSPQGRVKQRLGDQFGKCL
jgi:hypothetical protein